MWPCKQKWHLANPFLNWSRAEVYVMVCGCGYLDGWFSSSSVLCVHILDLVVLVVHSGHYVGWAYTLLSRALVEPVCREQLVTMCWPALHGGYPTVMALGLVATPIPVRAIEVTAGAGVIAQPCTLPTPMDLGSIPNNPYGPLSLPRPISDRRQVWTHFCWTLG